MWGRDPESASAHLFPLFASGSWIFPLASLLVTSATISGVNALGGGPRRLAICAACVAVMPHSIIALDFVVWSGSCLVDVSVDVEGVFVACVFVVDVESSGANGAGDPETV